MKKPRFLNPILALALLGTICACGKRTLSEGSSDATSGVTFPIEMMAYDPLVRAVGVNVPFDAATSSFVALSLRIHGIEYPDQVSVQVNGAPPVSINDSAVQLTPKEIAFGGVGGGFHSLDLTIPLPAGTLVGGSNTVTFAYNGTDGTNSGIRILDINFLTANGTPLFDSAANPWDDPAAWTGPQTDAATIAQGKQLFQTAKLAFSPRNSQPMLAQCGDCHAADGRDLEYYSFSNQSIINRSQFHGLTEPQGEAIASYIRTLSSTLPGVGRYGRPWNPPYQPGPGLDSLPVEQWAAGAGLGAVLVDDNAMFGYLMPGGSTRNFNASTYINTHEMPLSWQLNDWNHWLPTIHPIDAFGSAFVNGVDCGGLGTCSPYLSYQKALAQLKVGDASSAANSSGLIDWGADYLAFETATYLSSTPTDSSGNWTDPTMAQKAMSLGHFNMVKTWEIMQAFQLEAVGGQVQADASGMTTVNPRSWFSGFPFMTSPVFAHIPAGNYAQLANGTAGGAHAIGHQWYLTQVVLNDGNGTQQGTGPIDYGYITADLANPNNFGNNLVSVGNLQTYIELKGLWSGHLLSGVSPAKLSAAGISLADTFFARFDVEAGSQMGNDMWSSVPLSQRQALLNGFLQAWIDADGSRMLAAFGQDATFPDASVGAETITPSGTDFPSQLINGIPQYLMLGADPSLLSQVATLASGVYPGYDWQGLLSATCGPTSNMSLGPESGTELPVGAWTCYGPGYAGASAPVMVSF